MIGVGAIFRDYRAGRLERDDEVAVLHAPAEEGYRLLSEALVDMRATLASAALARIVSAKTALSLERIASATFFKDRSWHRIVKLAAVEGVPKRQLVRFSEWLPDNRIEQKRRDGLALIAAMSRQLARRPRPFRPRFTFQHTGFWQAVVEEDRRA
jgi:hypothetical protein